MKKLFITLLVTCYLLPNTCKAQTPYVAIPDSNFVHYLKTIVPAAFKGDSLNTSSTVVTTTTHTINCGLWSITNLFGIQYFTSLTNLQCNSNSLTSLPFLPNSLRVLNCYSNSLTSLPSLPNSLDTLYCYGNSLSSLPALPHSLTYLDCSINSLTSLPTLPNTLTRLYCKDNSLINLPALPNTLTYLYCASNNLTALPALPNSLTYLQCNNNSLTSLPTLPNSLNALYCYNNNIVCFPTFPTSIYPPYYIGALYTWTYYIDIDPNPYNCLPNHIAAMDTTDLAVPLCAAGNTNGCAVAGIEQIAGINNQVTVYPNPASSSLQVSFSSNIENSTLIITDMLGNVIYHSTFTTQHYTINVADLSEGVYNLSISTNEGLLNKRVVIER